jgi:hypothetical protein
LPQAVPAVAFGEYLRRLQLPAVHYIAEEVPELLLAEVLAFLAR